MTTVGNDSSPPQSGQALAPSRRRYGSEEMTPYIAGNDGESRMADQSQYQLFETAAGIAAIGWKGDDITRFRLPAPAASETERANSRHPPGPPRAEPAGGNAPGHHPPT